MFVSFDKRGLFAALALSGFLLSGCNEDTYASSEVSLSPVQPAQFHSFSGPAGPAPARMTIGEKTVQTDQDTAVSAKRTLAYSHSIGIRLAADQIRNTWSQVQQACQTSQAFGCLVLSAEFHDHGTDTGPRAA